MRRSHHAAWLLLLTAAAACTPSDDTAPRESASKPPPASTTAEATAPATPQVVEPPRLDEGLGEVRAGQRAATRGNASFEYTNGKQGKSLIVAVSCQGGGRISVKVPAVHVSFPLDCPKESPSVTYNQFALKAAHKAGTVSVEAPSTVSWSVTVGRGEPPAGPAD